MVNYIKVLSLYSSFLLGISCFLFFLFFETKEKIAHLEFVFLQLSLSKYVSSFFLQIKP